MSPYKVQREALFQSYIYWNARGISQTEKQEIEKKYPEAVKMRMTLSAIVHRLFLDIYVPAEKSRRETIKEIVIIRLSDSKTSKIHAQMSSLLLDDIENEEKILKDVEKISEKTDGIWRKFLKFLSSIVCAIGCLFD